MACRGALPLLPLLLWALAGLTWNVAAEGVEALAPDDDTSEVQVLSVDAIAAVQRRRERFSAEGSYSLGVNRGVPAVKPELGESSSASMEATMDARVAAVCGGNASSCSLEDIRKIWKHAWQTGFDSCTRGVGVPMDDEARRTQQNPFRSRKGLCRNNSIYISDWLVRNSHVGCWLVYDQTESANKKFKSMVSNKGLPPKDKQNTNFYSELCTNLSLIHI
eukprot:TRINITY_DN14558_c0_g1_i1.p1 TRINITY_DN14558_c0_g1~~TRINITY_DN14558_c0_g1_i1.p1  ORF type:complete len:220 (-),score=52.55 TRINITY_DN14558_c0_g1_i1:162-821(-)